MQHHLKQIQQLSMMLLHLQEILNFKHVISLFKQSGFSILHSFKHSATQEVIFFRKEKN